MIMSATQTGPDTGRPDDRRGGDPRIGWSSAEATHAPALLHRRDGILPTVAAALRHTMSHLTNSPNLTKLELDFGIPYPPANLKAGDNSTLPQDTLWKFPSLTVLELRLYCGRTRTDSRLIAQLPEHLEVPKL